MFAALNARMIGEKIHVHLDLCVWSRPGIQSRNTSQKYIYYIYKYIYIYRLSYRISYYIRSRGLYQLYVSYYRMAIVEYVIVFVAVAVVAVAVVVFVVGVVVDDEV